MPIVIRETHMKRSNGFDNNIQSRAPRDGSVPGGTRHAAIGTTVQIGMPIAYEYDDIDDVPFFLGLYIKMLVNQGPQARHSVQDGISRRKGQA